jgi:hypothetical protein
MRQYRTPKADSFTAFGPVAVIRALALCNILSYDCLYFNFSLTNNKISSCAGMNGIDEVIVGRANEITALSARGENLVASCAKLSAAETETLEEAVCTRDVLSIALKPQN